MFLVWRSSHWVLVFWCVINFQLFLLNCNRSSKCIFKTFFLFIHFPNIWVQWQFLQIYYEQHRAIPLLFSPDQNRNYGVERQFRSSHQYGHWKECVRSPPLEPVSLYQFWVSLVVTPPWHHTKIWLKMFWNKQHFIKDYELSEDSTFTIYPNISSKQKGRLTSQRFT